MSDIDGLVKEVKKSLLYEAEIRNRTIDNFVKHIKMHYKNYKCVPSIEKIMEIAERMKME